MPGAPEGHWLARSARCFQAGFLQLTLGRGCLGHPGIGAPTRPVSVERWGSEGTGLWCAPPHLLCDLKKPVPSLGSLQHLSEQGLDSTWRL